ncbi:hypothetical protein V8G54_004051 [Vigna mungo]|uniref:Reticulon domain-containing protein n=1 Tax=Vigna mungo TaxID=3915 RepID=A0AAQ3PEZ0_VIGMU
MGRKEKKRVEKKEKEKEKKKEKKIMDERRRGGEGAGKAMIAVPVDPLEWQISEDTANAIVAWLANTVGAAESVLRVAATGHDKRLFLKVTLSLYLFSAIGRFALGITVAYAGNHSFSTSPLLRPCQ